MAQAGRVSRSGIIVQVRANADLEPLNVKLSRRAACRDPRDPLPPTRSPVASGCGYSLPGSASLLAAAVNSATNSDGLRIRMEGQRLSRTARRLRTPLSQVKKSW